MAEADDPGEGAEEELDEESEGESEDASSTRRFSGRTLVLYVIAPLLVVIVGGGGAYLSGLFGSSESDQMADGPVEPHVFYELPGMLVNLASHGESRAQYLKVKISIELPGEEAKKALEPVLPRVVDLFQIYLREMRATDLKGSAGIYRLKEELERRINLEIQPFSVNDVLFREIIVQ